jgi:CheY-like chemotaxis protein
MGDSAGKFFQRNGPCFHQNEKGDGATTTNITAEPARKVTMSRLRTDNLRDCVLLYVEDDDATAYLFQLALDEAGIAARCFRVTDGPDALDFVLRRDVYSQAPLPDLVILDLNLPKMSGFEVLAEIRRCGFAELTIVVYSSSESPRDKETALELGADSYLVKGGDLSKFVESARAACALVPRGPVFRSA